MFSMCFFASLHAHGSWPKLMQFDVDEKIQPPFAALAKTPAGGFGAM
jgi:hypothetical protein